MRLSLRLAAFLAVVVCLQVGLNGLIEGQEFRQTLRDYHTDRPFYYQPSDPVTRGKVFNAQTGHHGHYYNCDGEECKRYSPYICWKLHCEKDIPPKVGIWKQLKRDLTEVHQRVKDGAGACYKNNCACAKCRKNTASSAGTYRVTPGKAATNKRTETNGSTQIVSKKFAPKKTTVTQQAEPGKDRFFETKPADIESIRQPIQSTTRPLSTFGLIHVR